MIEHHPDTELVAVSGEQLVAVSGEQLVAVSGEPAEEETVDGLPVIADVRPVERAQPGLPAMHAAAAAATGFVAGAATVALVRRRSARKLAQARRTGVRRPVDLLPIVSSRTFLVDVHLLAKPGE